jgi:hypothetical protein
VRVAWWCGVAVVVVAGVWVAWSIAADLIARPRDAWAVVMFGAGSLVGAAWDRGRGGRR